MKPSLTLFSLFLSGLVFLLLPGTGRGQEDVRMDYFGEAYQLVYFGVLEGLFQDGVKSREVDLILKQNEGGVAYEHFIYACPICMATMHALEFYRKRPRFYGIKDHSPPAKFRTFGPGLSKEIRVNLAHEDVKVRLATIHELVGGWVNARLEASDLTEEERDNLQVQLEAGRKRGMKMLESYKNKGTETLATFAPGYGELKECAVCNAALQMDFRTN